MPLFPYIPVHKSTQCTVSFCASWWRRQQAANASAPSNEVAAAAAARARVCVGGGRLHAYPHGSRIPIAVLIGELHFQSLK